MRLLHRLVGARLEYLHAHIREGCVAVRAGRELQPNLAYDVHRHLQGVVGANPPLQHGRVSTVQDCVGSLGADCGPAGGCSGKERDSKDCCRSDCSETAVWVWHQTSVDGGNAAGFLRRSSARTHQADPGNRSYIGAMPPATPRAFRKAIEGGQVAPAYLLHGDDDFRKDADLRIAVDALVDPATRDFNYEVRRGADLAADTLHALLNTPPMMADRRVMVLREVSALRKQAREALDRYLANPAGDVVLLMTVAGGVKFDKWLTALSKSVAEVEYGRLSGQHLPKWVEHQAAELGGSIDSGAVELLVSAVGDDTALLSAELDKLLSFTGGEEITRHAVGEIVGIRHGETLGDLLDAVLERNARRSIELLRVVLAQPKVTGVSIIMALTVQTLALAWGRAAREEGMSASQLEREFFNLLREGKAFPGRSWGEATKAWARSLPRWNAAALDYSLHALIAADVALKETTVATEEQIVSTCLLAMCASDVPSGSRRSAA